MGCAPSSVKEGYDERYDSLLWDFNQMAQEKDYHLKELSKQNDIVVKHLYEIGIKYDILSKGLFESLLTSRPIYIIWKNWNNLFFKYRPKETCKVVIYILNNTILDGLLLA